MPEKMHFGEVKIRNKRSAMAFHSLSQLCPSLSAYELKVCGKIGIEGWAAIAESVKKVRNVSCLWVSRELLMEAPKTDLRVLWEGVSHWFVTLERFGEDDQAEELGGTFAVFFRDHGPLLQYHYLMSHFAYRFWVVKT